MKDVELGVAGVDDVGHGGGHGGGGDDVCEEGAVLGVAQVVGFGAWGVLAEVGVDDAGLDDADGDVVLGEFLTCGQ